MKTNKCQWCKKYSIKGLYRCEITGQIFKKECYGYTPSEVKYYGCENDCPHFTAGLFDRILSWINAH